MSGELLPYAIQCLSTSVTNLFIFLLFNKIYYPKYKNKWIYIVAFAISTILFIFVNRLMSNLNNAFLNTIYLLIHTNTICLILFKASIKKSLMYNLLYIIISVFVEILSVILWALIKQETLTILLSSVENLFIVHITYTLLIFLVWLVFVTILSKSQLTEVKNKQTILVAIFTIFAAFIEYNLTVRVNSIDDGAIIICALLGFLFFSIYIVYFTGEISKTYKLKAESEMISKQSELQLEHYNEMNRKYEEARKVIHDIRKHLNVINALKTSDSELANEYSNIIERQVNSLFCGFQCSNRILSIIMSQKLIVAEKEKIRVNTNIEDITLEHISDLDITAIFANLWDNAIEACKKIDTSDRYINIIVGKVNDYIVISFENNYNGILRKLGESGLKSTKDQHDGVGITIIRNSVEKYNGYLNFITDNKVFRVEIMLPLVNE